MKFWIIFDKILNIMAGIAGVIAVIICAAVCYSIGMRFFFTKTTIWLMQTTEYALLWIVFLSTAWLLKEGGHITTDIIYSHLSNKSKKYLNFIMFIVCGLACAIMFYFSAKYMIESIMRNVTDVRAVTIPLWTVFCIIPIGSILLVIQFFRMAWGDLTKIRAGR